MPCLLLRFAQRAGALFCLQQHDKAVYTLQHCQMLTATRETMNSLPAGLLYELLVNIYAKHTSTRKSRCDCHGYKASITAYVQAPFIMEPLFLEYLHSTSTLQQGR